MAGSSIFKGGNTKYHNNIRNLRNSWRISENKKFLNRILLKTAIYDLYLSKNNSTKILVTPNDPWPGDVSLSVMVFFKVTLIFPVLIENYYLKVTMEN